MSHVPFAAIDRTCSLVPEQLPWLAHTDYWQRFDVIEQRRANQLMGLLINELCLALERGLVLVGLRQALMAPALRNLPILRRRLSVMLADERRHAEWFASYNHLFAPEIYGIDGFHFVRLPPFFARLAGFAATLPGAWRLAVWLTLATEEWACALAVALNHEPCGNLGPRDEGYRRLHDAHCRDEQRHLELDAELLAVAAHGLPVGLRQAVVAVARIGLAQLMRPRRAAPAMLQRFVTEFPRWRSELPGLMAAVSKVGATPDYWRTRGVGADLVMTTACAAEWGMRWPQPAEVAGV